MTQAYRAVAQKSLCAGVQMVTTAALSRSEAWQPARTSPPVTHSFRHKKAFLARPRSHARGFSRKVDRFIVATETNSLRSTPARRRRDTDALFQIEGVDGGLIGGASHNADQFLAIIRAAVQA